MHFLKIVSRGDVYLGLQSTIKSITSAFNCLLSKSAIEKVKDQKLSLNSSSALILFNSLLLLEIGEKH